MYGLTFSGDWRECTDFNVAVYTTFDHSYNRQVTPAPFILGSTIAERQQTGVPITGLPIVQCLTDEMRSRKFHDSRRR